VSISAVAFIWPAAKVRSGAQSVEAAHYLVELEFSAVELTCVRLRFTLPCLQILEVTAIATTAVVAFSTYNGVRARFTQDETFSAARTLHLVHQAYFVVANTQAHTHGFQVERKRFFARGTHDGH